MKTKTNFKTKSAFLKTKIFLFFWKRHINKAAIIKKLQTFYYESILGLICMISDHIWSEDKMEWSPIVFALKYRECSRCHKKQKYKSIISKELA